MSLCAWAGTLAVSATAIGAGLALGGWGVALGFGVSFLANAANMAAQSLFRKRFNDTLSSTWNEIQQEFDTMDISRAPALAGVMHLLVDKYSPLLLWRNRTQFWIGKQPLSTQAVLDHLKEACGAALNNLAANTEGYFKATDVNQKVKLANTGLTALKGRWEWHFKKSAIAESLLTTGSALAAFGLAAAA